MSLVYMRQLTLWLFTLSFPKASQPIIAMPLPGVMSISYGSVMGMKSYLHAHSNRRSVCTLLSIKRALGSANVNGCVVGA